MANEAPQGRPNPGDGSPAALALPDAGVENEPAVTTPDTPAGASLLPENESTAGYPPPDTAGPAVRVETGLANPVGESPSEPQAPGALMVAAAAAASVPPNDSVYTPPAAMESGYTDSTSAAEPVVQGGASPAVAEPAENTPAAAITTAPRPTQVDTDEEDEKEGGGPVKPFLDHLEDLRWTLLKVVVSILLGMLVCLVAGNRLVTFLTWPLNHAQRMLPASQQRVPLLLGTNEVGRVQLGSVHLPSTVDSNRVSALELVPTPLGDRLMLALSIQTNRAPDRTEANLVVLKNYGPISAFMVALKLALYGGLVISSPFVIFFIGQFVLPALKVKEKAFLYRIAGMGSVLFILGVAFCYLVIVQVALMASVQFSQWMGFGADEWRAEDYISFVCKFMLGMGLSFQLPLVILTLVKIGLVDHEMLANYRAYFIVGNLTLSAVVTPSGDPLTMVLMALPLQFLYEASVLVARYWARKDREREAAEEAATARGHG
jgi:sec-independent protein translocase protein TatC